MIEIGDISIEACPISDCRDHEISRKYLFGATQSFERHATFNLNRNMDDWYTWYIYWKTEAGLTPIARFHSIPDESQITGVSHYCIHFLPPHFLPAPENSFNTVFDGAQRTYQRTEDYIILTADRVLDALLQKNLAEALREKKEEDDAGPIT